MVMVGGNGKGVVRARELVRLKLPVTFLCYVETVEAPLVVLAYFHVKISFILDKNIKRTNIQGSNGNVPES